MDGVNRSCGWETKIPHAILPMGQLVLSKKLVRMHCTGLLFEKRENRHKKEENPYTYSKDIRFGHTGSDPKPT